MPVRSSVGMRGGIHSRGRSSTIWDYLRTSLWFVPALMMLIAVLLLWAGMAWDAKLGTSGGQQAPWWVYVSKPDAARDVLSTVLSSMIGMASLVFSITMVVLTLAASQFGPRLVRNFMASPHTQFVLGTFVMTIVYCVLALSSVGRRQGSDVLPFSIVTIALALTLLSTGVLVFFLHTLARSIVSETVIERVGRELGGIIEALEPVRPEEAPHPRTSLPPDFEQNAAVFGTSEAGYVQTIDFEQLVSIAHQADIVIGLSFRAGDFVVEGGRSIAVHPSERAAEQAIEEIRKAVLIGVHRTPIQDPDFSIRHLVEVAVRALSPGMNDPYTAVAVLDQLSASLSRLLARSPPSGIFRDGAGEMRVVCPAPTYSTLLAAAFNQIRQCGAGTPVVAIHMLEAIERIGQHAVLPSQVDALRAQLSTIWDTAEANITQASDRADVHAVYEKALRSLDQESERVARASAGQSGRGSSSALTR
ncbi:DUF2254 domain-containing protein [Micromonospora sp. STR1s_5]|nr:DUF2254 domain-containing protein [Micromonospora sp. STR1s_5]